MLKGDHLNWTVVELLVIFSSEQWILKKYFWTIPRSFFSVIPGFLVVSELNLILYAVGTVSRSNLVYLF